MLFACVNYKGVLTVRTGDVYLALVTRKSKRLFAFFAFDEFVGLSLVEFVLLKGKLLFYSAGKFQP